MRVVLPLLLWLTACNSMLPFHAGASRDGKTSPSDGAGEPRADGRAHDALPGDAAPADRGALDLPPGTHRSWVKAATGPKLWGPALAYHAGTQSIVLYGGNTAYWTALASASAAMWSYKGGTWTLLCASCLPGARLMHGLAHDSARDRLVLYGGYDGSGAARDDVWEWSQASGWVQREWEGPGRPGASSS